MNINTNVSADDGVITIRLPKEFTFNLHKEFRATHNPVQPGLTYIIDLARTENIDSSALGMLLLMRDEMGGDDANIRIVNCIPHIKDLFEISGFDRLFDVS